MQFPKTSEAVAQDILTALDYDPTRTNIKQMQVLLDAFDKFVERNKMYIDLWKDGGAADSIRNMDSKVRRLGALNVSLLMDRREAIGELTKIKLVEAFLDDALDEVNYAVFAARNMHSGRLDGETGDIRSDDPSPAGYTPGKPMGATDDPHPGPGEPSMGTAADD